MINNLSNRQKIVSLILLVLILVTLAVIFGNSLKNQQESGAQSSAVVDTVKPIVDADNSIPRDVFELAIRKLAHFTEFLILAIELSVLYIVVTRKNPSFLIFLIIIFLISISALSDETIQIFSGRGSSVIDVWIDISGGIFGTILVILINKLKKRQQPQA